MEHIEKERDALREINQSLLTGTLALHEIVQHLRTCRACEPHLGRICAEFPLLVLAAEVVSEHAFDAARASLRGKKIMSERYGDCPFCLGRGLLYSSARGKWEECGACDGSGFDGNVFAQRFRRPMDAEQAKRHVERLKQGDEAAVVAFKKATNDKLH